MQEVEAAAVSTNNINFQMGKANKPLTDLKIVVPEEYHDFLDVFSKKALDTVTKHSKYDHWIKELKEYKDLDYSFLQDMLQAQLEFVKEFLESNLKKKFIETSSSPYSLPILLAKKPESSIKFCIDYWQLNKITKKDAYLIPLIEEMLMQLKLAKIFSKIDI